MRRLAFVLFGALIATAALAQDEVMPRDPNAPPLKPLPAGVILLPGAVPHASDTKTPLPEDGRIARDVYRNAYFGLTYPLPEGWSQEFTGPPPSDAGLYVLAELASKAGGSMLVTAQDLFFNLTPASTAAEGVRFSNDHLASYYKVERPPAEVEIAKRKFTRFDYMSPAAELHWSVLATEVRCHALQFVVTSRDPRIVDTMIDSLNGLELDTHDAPLCVPRYAQPETIAYKVDPQLTTHRGESMPVRIVIGKTGRVEHVHVISAFPEEAAIITDALLQWKFKPHVVNGEPVSVETGLVFGVDRRRATVPRTAAME